MKTVIAIDKFKGCLTSLEAGTAVQEAIRKKHPDWDTQVITIADGGEGMLQVMLEAHQGKMHTTRVHNARMDPIKSTYGVSDDGSTAFIEMATASGLQLIPGEQRNPMKTTTYGTGELIRKALEQGCTQVVVGLGGSATNDAGMGMLQALGYCFRDAEGKILGQGGEMMKKVHSIDFSNVHPLLEKVSFTAACDVQNPLYGPQGAAWVFAPQKGADEIMAAELDEGMQSLSETVRRITGKRTADLPGSGAAGGLGWALATFLNAKLVPGAELLLQAARLDHHLQGADLVITGEGKMDRQSLMGKITGKILDTAKQKGIPVMALAGQIEEKPLLLEAGFASVYAITPDFMPLEMAMKPDVAKYNLQESVLHALKQTFNCD